VSEFRKKLESLINVTSMENGSNTPDFILADYLAGCLENFDRAVLNRETWYGHHHTPGQQEPCEEPCPTRP